MDSAAQVGQPNNRPRREERQSMVVCAAEVRALLAAQQILTSCINLGAAPQQDGSKHPAPRTLQDRQRLARDLYDGVAQTLFSANLIADVLPRIYERSPQEGRARLEELRRLTHGALAEMRAILDELGTSAQAAGNAEANAAADAAAYAAAAADLDGLERWLNEVEIG